MATNDDDVTTATGRLYERWTLDVLSALAPAAAALFKVRPQRFKRLEPGIADALARFHYQTGYNEGNLDHSQRKALLVPLLGESDGTAHEDDTSEFHRAASAVRAAAVDFAQRSEETGVAQLRAAFRDTLTTFERYLTSIEGAGVQNAVRRVTSYFDATVDVFEDAGFAAAFGVPPAPSANNWPFDLDLSGDGAVLVEEVGQQAAAAEFAPAIRADQHTFILMQRIGHFGRRTIEGAAGAGALDDAAIDALIDDAYRWWTALRNLREA